MTQKIEKIIQAFLKNDNPDIKAGDTIRVHQKIREKDKEKIQVFEGIVLARRHGKGINTTITVRKVISGIGVERIFPIHSPNIAKIEVINKGKVRRAKIYYLRGAKGRKARLKRIDKKGKVTNKETTPGESLPATLEPENQQ